MEDISLEREQKDLKRKRIDNKTQKGVPGSFILIFDSYKPHCNKKC